MRQSATGLVEEGNCDIPKSTPCANRSDSGIIVNENIVEVAEVNNQVPVCATKAVCCI